METQVKIRTGKEVKTGPAVGGEADFANKKKVCTLEGIEGENLRQKLEMLLGRRSGK